MKISPMLLDGWKTFRLMRTARASSHWPPQRLQRVQEARLRKLLVMVPVSWRGSPLTFAGLCQARSSCRLSVSRISREFLGKRSIDLVMGLAPGSLPTLDLTQQLSPSWSIPGLQRLFVLSSGEAEGEHESNIIFCDAARFLQEYGGVG